VGRQRRVSRTCRDRTFQAPIFKKQIIASSYIAAGNKLVVECFGAAVAKSARRLQVTPISFDY
jgi:hypothetical protein